VVILKTLDLRNGIIFWGLHLVRLSHEKITEKRQYVVFLEYYHMRRIKAGWTAGVNSLSVAIGQIFKVTGFFVMLYEATF
jgi:hypothetical protein